MSEKHLSSQYDAELSGISNQVMHMGGLAESQVAQAIYALTKLSAETAERVEANEVKVNQLEMEIDSPDDAWIVFGRDRVKSGSTARSPDATPP